MVGNVSEWMLDAHCSSFDHKCYDCWCRGDQRSIRYGARERGAMPPGFLDSNIGFRCAKSIAAKDTPRACPAGTIYALGQCVAEKNGACPAGMHSRGHACVPDGSP